MTKQESALVGSIMRDMMHAVEAAWKRNDRRAARYVEAALASCAALGLDGRQ